MNVIVFSRRVGWVRELNLAHPVTLAIIAAVALGILGTAFGLGMRLGRGGSQQLALGETGRWAAVLAEQKTQIADVRARVQERVDAMAMRLGEINAHVIRLDALGKRLTEMADIDNHEFDFDRSPPSGGPEADGEGVSAQIPDLAKMLGALEQSVSLRDSQLAALENVILARDLKEQIHPEGRPVTAGFISSYFGKREDPFSGHEAYHKGVDFAGTAGANVIAVAAGVVTWAGARSGYGNLVEINHGDGYVTRYAHNERALVSVGQTVKRGEPVALLGSTGHSTGPHVHFEVLRNGRQVDPLSYVGRH
ncbi:MAG: M23 family metallopeptidase [Gammaproteobacteria bacterium]|nr:MAG: M23 family metallopeptidase [Gammaproteobacteria bacterium]TLY79383.1 MAG: M23 family metallopeptidase [Gammaproteobacteria bacterium]